MWGRHTHWPDSAEQLGRSRAGQRALASYKGTHWTWLCICHETLNGYKTPVGFYFLWEISTWKNHVLGFIPNSACPGLSRLPPPPCLHDALSTPSWGFSIDMTNVPVLMIFFSCWLPALFSAATSFLGLRSKYPTPRRTVLT